jgi:hypothetical protein
MSKEPSRATLAGKLLGWIFVAVAAALAARLVWEFTKVLLAPLAVLGALCVVYMVIMRRWFR